MPCKITKANNGKVNGVLNESGDKSILFQKILNTPTLSLDEAIQTYKNLYSSKLKGKVKRQGVETTIPLKEAERITKYLTKKYGIESAMVDMGLFSAYGEFDRNNLNIRINTQTTLNEQGELTAATEPTGFVSRGTIFHEYLHPFVEVLEKENKELYDEIYNSAVEENNNSNFTDVSNYEGFKQKEELVVRYLERLSTEDKVPSLLERFLAWVSEFFHKKRKTNKATLKNLSKDTTVEELYEVFKNYDNLRQDIQDVVNEDNQESRIQFLNNIINNTEIPQNVRDNFQRELDNITDGRRFQVLSDYRDNTKFKYSDLIYPDVVFKDITNKSEVKVATNFYKKIINKFNKTFDRDLKIESSETNNDFTVTVEYETGLKPKYFAYPTAVMGEHQTVNNIDKNVPLTSLRHELIHEMLVKNITDKFERINNLDNSANITSIEEVQRNRAYNYTLEDVFFERVVENIERNPDNKDTFEVSTFGTDIINRVKKELGNTSPTKENVLSTLEELFQDSNPWLKSTVLDIFQNKVDYSVNDLSELNEIVGKAFKQRFDLSKDIFTKDLQAKIFEFTTFFNEEYTGVLTRLNKIGQRNKLTRAVSGNRLFSEPLEEASKIANEYMLEKGITIEPIQKITQLDTENSKRIAEEFDKMEVTPNDPQTIASYKAMIDETLEQYEKILSSGYKIEVNNSEPYSSSSDMISDLRDNKRMKIFSTESGFGDVAITEEQRRNNPLLQETEFKDVNGVPLLANDIFRFVHDFFGHAKLGNGFGAIGEENAWNIHSKMYSPLAKRAMTTETRGQNSWVNFSGVNEGVFKKRDKARELRQQGKFDEAKKLTEEVYEEMSFAEQKIGLLPEWVSTPITEQKVVEPNLSFETPSGESFDTYQEALKNTDEGLIKLNIEGITVAEVNSDTNVETFNGTINHLVKQGGLTGERILDVNGDIVYITKGETDGAKHIASELVEKQAVKLLGQSGVKMTKAGDFILSDTLNKITINEKEYDKKEIDELNYDQLEKKFGKNTALQIEFSREYSKAIQPTKTKKRLEEVTELKIEDELVSAIKSLLNKLGIKLTSIEDYIKHNTLKNNDVAPESTALMDLVNKVMAFRNGTITREDLIEETMHLIEATIDPKTTEGIRRNIDKTAEWKQYSEHYRQIYSKEYSGEKLDEMVRREILGKVMTNAVINNFALSENSTLTEQSIFDRIRELLQQFFDRIEAFFKPEYQQQIEQLNNDIYAKLMSGTLVNEMNLDQNYGTKFRLYSTSNDMTNEVVRLQKQAEKALDVLRNNVTNLEGKDPSQAQMIKSAKDLLRRVEDSIKKGDSVEAKVESIATFSKVLNIVQKQTKYLERAVKKSTQNKHPFSAEEMIVYNNLVNEFGKSILPVINNILKKEESSQTKAEKRILEEVGKASQNINDLIGQVENSGFNAKDYVVDLLVNRLGLDKETEDFLRERADSQQKEANWFFMQFGNLSHSSNVYLNALGHVITKTDFDKRQGFQQDLKPFIARIKKVGMLSNLSSLADGNHIQSAHNFTEIEKAENTKKHELFYSLIAKRIADPSLTAEQKKEAEEILKNKVTVEEFSNIDIIDNLGSDLSVEFEKEMDLWALEKYRLSPLNPQTMLERRERLKNYSQVTQDYERNSSASYSSIMGNAEIVDGIPLITEDMRYDIEDLKKLRIYDKSIYDQDGDLKKGINIVRESDSGAIKISDNLFVTLSQDANSDAVLAVELNQIDNQRIIDNEGKFNNRTGMPDSFKEMLSKLGDSEAYDFLMLNSYVGYTEEYYDNLKKPGIVDRLEESKTEEDEADIDSLIEEIVTTTKKVNTILRANRMMNNPSETNFDRMDFYEVNSVKEYAQKLEYLYSEARKYLPKQAQEEMEQESIAETIINKAFANYMMDTARVSQLDYSEKTSLTAEEKQNIDKIFGAIESHTTQNKREEIVGLRKDIKGFAKGRLNKLSNRHKRVFKLTAEEYAEMSEEETFAYMTNELLKYSYTKLHPYFRKSQPIGVDKALLDLETGMMSASDFIQNYEAGNYPYLKISPNYNFQEVTEDNNKNPHFQNAKVNSTPMYRIFEAETTLEDVQNKSIDQLKSEGKLNAYTNIDFLKEYDIDMVELFNTGKEIARKNNERFEARQALIDLQKVSLEKNGVLGKHNLYQLPQKEASKTRKFDNFLKSGKDLKTVFDEMFNFREDEAELGQDAGKAKSIKTDGNYTIPKFGLRKLKEAPVTDDLLESYVWMNYKANEYQARKNNIGDAIAVNQALMNAEFEGNIDVKTSNAYKTFKESYDFNFYGVKEVWSNQFKILGMTFDWAKILKNFGWLIRLRNLGFTVISPITSALTGSVFLRIESLVGEIVDKDTLPIVNKFFAKYAGEASREMLSLESKSMLNSLGELWGWYDPMERYDNTMYSKALRGLQKTPFAAHQLANFPVNTRVGLAVLANSKFVEGNMLEFRQYKKANKGKSDKELRKEWAKYTSVLDVTTLEKDGTISYDYNKISDALNNNFTEEETKKFMEDKSVIIRGRIKSAIQNVDGQISVEDKSMSTRNAFFSFMNIHRSWLMIATQNKLKRRQLNTSTGYIEEGSYRAVGGLFLDVFKDAQRTGVVNALNKIRTDWKGYDEVTKRAVSRTLWEWSILNVLVGLTVLAMNELGDDEPDSLLFQQGSLFMFRVTNEVASSTVSLPRNLYDTLENVIVGLNTVEIATQFPDVFSSEIVERGRYKSLTERERYFYRHMPLMRDYNNLWRDNLGNIKSYNYFNFVRGKSLDYFTLYPFLKETEN